MGRGKKLRLYQWGLLCAGLMAAATFANFLVAIPRLLYVDRMGWAEILAGMLQAVLLALALGYGAGLVIGITLPLVCWAGRRWSILGGALGTPVIVLVALGVADRSLVQMEYLGRSVVLAVVVGILGGLFGLCVWNLSDEENAATEDVQ